MPSWLRSKTAITGWKWTSRSGHQTVRRPHSIAPPVRHCHVSKRWQGASLQHGWLCAGYKGASDMYIDTNVQLAIAAARQLSEKGGLRVHILVPDQTEFNRSYKM